MRLKETWAGRDDNFTIIFTLANFLTPRGNHKDIMKLTFLWPYRTINMWKVDVRSINIHITHFFFFNHQVPEQFLWSGVCGVAG